MSYDEHDWERDRHLESLGQGAEYWENQYQASSERIIQEIRELVAPKPIRYETEKGVYVLVEKTEGEDIYVFVNMTKPEAEVTKRALEMYLHKQTPNVKDDMTRKAWMEAWDVYSKMTKAGREAEAYHASHQRR